MKVPFSIGFWLLFLLAAPFVFVATLVLAAITARRDPDRRLVHAFVSRSSSRSSD